MRLSSAARETMRPSAFGTCDQATPSVLCSSPFVDAMNQVPCGERTSGFEPPVALPGADDCQCAPSSSLTLRPVGPAPMATTTLALIGKTPPPSPFGGATKVLQVRPPLV